MSHRDSFLDIIHDYLSNDHTRLLVFEKPEKSFQDQMLEEEPDLVAIQQFILTDPSFAFHVLKAANSAFFKGLTKVSTIRNAIIRLGTGEIFKIMSSIAEPESVDIRDPFCKGMIEKLWQHSLGCAIGTRWLAKQCGFESLSEESFIAGLLHDIGKLLLITVVENLTRLKKHELRPSDTLLKEVMENFHVEQGAMLLEKWNLPDSYCRIVRNHHNEEMDANDTLLLMVRLVNKACNKLGIGLVEDRAAILAATQEASLLGLSEIFLAKLEITLEDTLLIEAASEPPLHENEDGSTFQHTRKVIQVS